MESRKRMTEATRLETYEEFGFRCHQFADECSFWTGTLPSELRPARELFDAVWATHPAEYHEILMHGRLVKTPRWQQEYGRDYPYTGRVNHALPITPLLAPFLEWAQREVDERLNGLLLNWYDAALGHYIGKHRDSTKTMVSGSPIVTISLGQTRTWRLRPWKSDGRANFEAKDGAVYIMPYATNLKWTHEVPKTKQPGRRISITVRAFQ